MCHGNSFLTNTAHLAADNLVYCNARWNKDDLVLMKRLISTVEQVKKDLQMKDNWLHRPKESWEFKNLKIDLGKI